MGKYLIYHIDEGLSIITTKVLNRLCFVTVGKYVRDQGDLVVRTEGKFDSVLPRRNAAACEKLVRSICAWFQNWDAQAT